VTPTVHVCPVLTMHDHTPPCMTVHIDVGDPDTTTHLNSSVLAIRPGSGRLAPRARR
jgi:hypothetical protein